MTPPAPIRRGKTACHEEGGRRGRAPASSFLPEKLEGSCPRQGRAVYLPPSLLSSSSALAARPLSRIMFATES